MSTSNGNGKQPLLEDDDELLSPLDQADDDQLSLQDGDSGHVHSSEVHSGDAKVDTPGGGSANGHTERTSSAGGNGKIFIGGLSWDTTTEKLENHFRKYGEITDAVIMRDRGSGTPRGFGFVTFADPGVCDSVLQDKHVLDGRSVECKRSIPRENMGVVKGPKTKKIFVGGIPPSISEEEFRDYFSNFGSVVEHQIMQDHNTGRSRGFGFIVFDSEQTVEDVLAHGRMHELGGKQVEIKKAEPKKAMQDSASAYYGPSRSSYGSSGAPYGYADYLLGGSAYGGSSYRGGGYSSRMYTHGSYGVGYGGYGGYGAGIGVGGYGVGSLGGGYLGSYNGGYMLGGYADDGYSGMGYGGGGGGGYGGGYSYGSSGSYGGGGGGGGSGGGGGYGHSSSSRGHSHGHSHSHSHSHGHSHGGSTSAGRYHPYSRY